MKSPGCAQGWSIVGMPQQSLTKGRSYSCGSSAGGGNAIVVASSHVVGAVRSRASAAIRVIQPLAGPGLVAQVYQRHPPHWKFDSQTSPGLVHCAAVTHSTQRTPLQNGWPPLQSALLAQPTQRPVTVLQSGVLFPQLALLKHCAQTPAVVLHSGLFCAAAQSPLVRHCRRQVRDAGWQTGAAAGQSLALRHPTQSFAVVSHFPAPHCVLLRQPTHVAVAVSHTGVVPPQSALPWQPPQRVGLPLQIGVAVGQLALLRQPPQTPPEQTGLAPGQSEFITQATQSFFRMSQMGVEPEQLALVKHCSHFEETQMGFPVGQSRLPAHWTHLLEARSQMGSAVGHWVFERHSTQRWVVGWHAGVPPPHWALLLHCTHSPLGTSQIRAWGFVHWVLVVQGATHTWLLGSHSGVTPPQFAFARQATQRLRVVSHSGVVPLHSALVAHWTHRFATHTGAGVGQSELPLHSTHAPADVQTRPPPQSGDVRQATQLIADEQNGRLPPHCAAVAHSTHRPRAVSHTWGAVQFALLLQGVGLLQVRVASSQVRPPEQLALPRHSTHLPAAVSQTIAPHCASDEQEAPGLTAGLPQVQLLNKARTAAMANSGVPFMDSP